MRPQHGDLDIGPGPVQLPGGVDVAGARRVLELADQAGVARGEPDIDRPAFVADRSHGDLPPLTGGSDHLVGGDDGIREEDLVELAVAVGLDDGPYLHAGLVEIDDQRRDALVTRGVRVGPGQQQAPVGPGGVAGPDLLAVDHIVVSAEAGPGGQGRQIRPGSRFAEALAPHLFAREKAGKESPSLVVEAEVEQGPAQEPDMGRRWSPGSADLLVEDGLVHGREAPPAVFDGPRQAHPPTLVEGAVPGAPEAGPFGPPERRRITGEVSRQPGPELVTEGRLGRIVAKIHQRTFVFVAAVTRRSSTMAPSWVRSSPRS